MEQRPKQPLRALTTFFLVLAAICLPVTILIPSATPSWYLLLLFYLFVLTAVSIGLSLFGRTRGIFIAPMVLAGIALLGLLAVLMFRPRVVIDHPSGFGVVLRLAMWFCWLAMGVCAVFAGLGWRKYYSRLKPNKP